MSDTHLTVLGFRVDKLTMETCLQRMLQLVAKGQGQVVTANAEILYAARRHPPLAKVIQEADIVTADGMGVVLAGKILGDTVPEKVSGVDLLHAFASVSAEQKVSWYLLGAAPGVAERARDKLLELYPGLQVVGCQHGYYSPEEAPQILSDIQKVRPHFLVVAMGLKQEYWIHENKSKLPCPAMGVGGSLDILAGTARRAPVWMQRVGLEWSHRLIREPRRFWRMLALPKFVLAVLAERLRSKEES